MSEENNSQRTTAPLYTVMFKNSGRAKIMKIFSKDILLLIFMITIFLIGEICFLRFPGVYVDEAGVAYETLDVKQALTGKVFIKEFLSGNLPLMRLYHGSLDVYILLFMFSIFPVGVESMRYVGIFFGVLTILLTYLFTRKFLNKRFALLTVFLLLINPGFIMGTKIGVHYGTVLNVVSLGVLLLLLSWYRDKRDIPLYLAMFLLGFGMWTRLQFFWFIFGVVFTAIIFRNDIKQRLKINKANKFFKYIFLCATFFLLGCSIIIYHEYKTNLSTLRYFWDCIKMPIGGEMSNLQYFPNLLRVIGNFCEILTSAHYFGYMFRYGHKFANNLYPWVLLISMAYLFTIAKLKKEVLFRKKILFLLVLFVGMFALTPFSPSGFPLFHLYFFYPYIQLIISFAALTFIQYFKKLKIAMAIFLIFFTLFIFNEINGVSGYFYLLKETGGRLFYSPAIYNLTEYLLKERPIDISACDWGIQCVIDITSGGLVRPRDLANEKGKIIGGRESLLRDKNSFFIFYAKETGFGNVGNFIANVKQLNLVPVEVRRFYERDGSPVYSVYTVIDPKNKK